MPSSPEDKSVISFKTKDETATDSGSPTSYSVLLHLSLSLFLSIQTHGVFRHFKNTFYLFIFNFLIRFVCHPSCLDVTKNIVTALLPWRDGWHINLIKKLKILRILDPRSMKNLTQQLQVDILRGMRESNPQTLYIIWACGLISVPHIKIKWIHTQRKKNCQNILPLPLMLAVGPGSFSSWWYWNPWVINRGISIFSPPEVINKSDQCSALIWNQTEKGLNNLYLPWHLKLQPNNRLKKGR